MQVTPHGASRAFATAGLAEPDRPAPEESGGPVIVRWDGAAPAALIAAVETCLAAGTRFAVLATAPPLGRASGDRMLLTRWWSTTHGRLTGLCAGWAVLVPGADVRPGQLARCGVQDPAAFQFPVRACADSAEASLWLHAKLAENDRTQ